MRSYTKMMLLKKGKASSYSKLKPKSLSSTLKFKLCKEEKSMFLEKKLNKLTEISTFHLNNGFKLIDNSNY
jgi:hypothetical protein